MRLRAQRVNRLDTAFEIGQRWIQVMLVMTSATAMAGTIDDSEQAPYEQCGFCHEYDGNSVMPGYPRLAGQKKAYLVKQLEDFRAGRRTGVMQGTAELLSDQDIETVAVYFSGQRVRGDNETAMSNEQKRLARRLIVRGDQARKVPPCLSCHGPGMFGSGDVPRLTGQHPKYLHKQLLAFRAGGRANDPAGQMRRIARELRDEEMEALAAYLGSYQRGSQDAQRQGDQQ
jgi:cytochrome c553